MTRDTHEKFQKKKYDEVDPQQVANGKLNLASNMLEINCTSGRFTKGITSLLHFSPGK